MTYSQGSVVLAPATFKSGLRPYLVVSNANRPFQGDRYTVAVVTSTERAPAIPITETGLRAGELKTYPSYVSPWSLHVFPHRDISKRVAHVDPSIVADVSDQIRAFTEVLS
ncbi:hypothetical protein GCM10028857_27020 [Salinarchaeum chitinilyticum]